MKNVMLYIHIPFCERKCNYCDFVSFVSTESTISLYINKLISEIIAKSQYLTDYNISSIYIGGGTPSIIDSKYIVDILNTVYKHFKVNKNSEISIELNPNSATKDKLKDYYSIGINRLSFGLQSANDDELKFLGRIHTYNDFVTSLNNAFDASFKNISVDIINGIPLQTAKSYINTLDKVFSFNITHISIYNLIIEENTVFYKLYKDKKIKEMDENDILKIDEITNEYTKKNNFSRYEISNYSKDGFSCAHNLGYWSDVEYIGLGLNASSYFNSERFKNFKNLKEYFEINYNNLGKMNNPEFYEELLHLSTNDLISEYTMLGFRKISGINAEHFYKKFNMKFDDVYNNQLNKYLNLGLIIKNNNNYFLSYDGLNVSNEILSDFII